MGKRAGSETRRASMPMVTHRATVAGTRRHAEAHALAQGGGFYRQSRAGLTCSSLAFGTYLGDSDDATDAMYVDAIGVALRSGINVIDTAINYRCQRSERAVGRALQSAIAAGDVRRDGVVVCTKAGYIPLEETPPATRADYERYLRTEYFDRGVLQPEDVVAGGHALAPAFLEDQLQRSLRNIGVQGIDVFYLHNPEQQLAAVTPEQLRARIRSAFELLESCVSRGVVGVYGCATWNGLRLPDGSHGHLSLFDLAAIAEEVAGKEHHFRVAQLPVNLSMSEAVRVSTQRDQRGRLKSVVEAAEILGIDLVISAPLLQGKLTDGLPAEVREAMPGSTDAQRALGFARGLPSVLTVAVGMKDAAHVRENLAGARSA